MANETKSKQELNAALREEIALRTQLAKVAQDDKKLIQVKIDAHNELIKKIRDENVVREKAIQAQAQGAEVHANFVETLRKELTVNGQLTQANADLLEQLGKTPDALRKIQREAEGAADSLAKIKEASESARDLGEAFGQATAGIMGIDMGWRKAGITGHLINAVDKGANLGEAMSEIGSEIAKTVNPMNLFGSAMTKIAAAAKQLLVSVGGAAGQLRQSLGGTRDFTREVGNLTSSLMEVNLSSEEARAVIDSLTRTVSEFTYIGGAARAETQEITGQLLNLGVGGEASAAAIQIMNKTIGMTIPAAARATADLALLAKELEIPPDIMIKDFGTAARVLAAHGKNINEEFKDMAVAAKKTGLEMNTLLSVAAGFDTFRDAADKVGSLNALLGGAYFDTVEMVSATESERVRLLMEGVSATGMSFSQLGRFERKAIANAAGITDMAEANKLFNTSLSAYDELQGLADNAEMSLSDLSSEAFNNLSWSQKFGVILKQLTPVINDLVIGLDYFAIGLNKVVKFIKNNAWAKWTALIGGGAFVVFKLVRAWKAFVALKGAIAAISGINAALAANTAAVAASTAAQGTAAAAAAPAIAAQGTAAAGAASGMAAFGVAVLKIGAGIGIATAGIGALAAGFSLMFKAMKGVDMGQLWSFLGWLTAFTAAAIGLGAIMGTGAGALLLGAGLLAIGTSMATLAGSLALLPEDEMNALAYLFSSISGLSATAVGNVTSLGAALAGLKIPKSESIQVVTNLVTRVSEIDATAATATRGIIKTTADLAKIKIDKNNIQFMQQLTMAISNLTKAVGGGGGAGAGGTVTVPFEVDGFALAQIVLPYAEGRFMGQVKGD